MKIAARDWQALSRLLDEALSLPVTARASWASRLGPEHTALKPILQELFTRDDLSPTGGFLETLPDISLPGEPMPGKASRRG
jgi:hypothetical protein